MARSNNTLSGCFDPTFANGLLTFLLVHATVAASTPRRKMTGIRRDIRTSEFRAQNDKTCPASRLDLQQSSLRGRLQEFLGIILWITGTEHRVASHQNFCPGANYLSNCIERDTAIDLDPVIVSAFLP